MNDWMGASVWRVGRTAEDRLVYRRSIKAARSKNRSAQSNEYRHLGYKILTHTDVKAHKNYHQNRHLIFSSTVFDIISELFAYVNLGQTDASAVGSLNGAQRYFRRSLPVKNLGGRLSF